MDKDTIQEQVPILPPDFEARLQELHEMGYVNVVLVLDMENEVLHACGYPAPPTQIDIDGLKKELAEDEEFGITDLVFGKDYKIVAISPVLN